MSQHKQSDATFNFAILKTHGLRFEIDVDPDLAMEFKKGGDVEIRNIIKVDNVFSDAKKGNIAKESDLEEVFKTTDIYEIAKQIIEKGDVQVSAEYRNKQRDQKKKQIIELIHRNAIDPTTKLPHPITRIENALDEIKFKIDENKTPKDHLDEIMKQLKVIIPIRFELKKIEIIIPATLAGKVYGKVIALGRKLNETWNNDGSLSVTIEIPAGIELEVYDTLNSLTSGQAETKVIGE